MHRVQEFFEVLGWVGILITELALLQYRYGPECIAYEALELYGYAMIGTVLVGVAFLISMPVNKLRKPRVG